MPYLAQATEETLALVLETIRAVINVDGSVMNEANTVQLSEVVLTVWLANVTGEIGVIRSIVVTVLILYTPRLQILT